jgi:hypothetical protein
MSGQSFGMSYEPAKASASNCSITLEVERLRGYRPGQGFNEWPKLWYELRTS